MGHLSGIARVKYYLKGQILRIEEGMFEKGKKNGKCRIIDQQICKVAVYKDDVE